MSSPLKQNTTTIQELLTIINNLPEASSGVELPELSNPATASELFLNKELIDSEGNKVTGTFTIDSELSTQDDLIAQIQSTLEGKAAAGGLSGGGTVETCNVVFEDYSGYTTWYYTDANMTLQTHTGTGIVTVPINTIVSYIGNISACGVISGNANPIFSIQKYGAIKVYGGCQIEIYDENVNS